MKYEANIYFHIPILKAIETSPLYFANAALCLFSVYKKEIFVFRLLCGLLNHACSDTLNMLLLFKHVWLHSRLEFPIVCVTL